MRTSRVLATLFRGSTRAPDDLPGGGRAAPDHVVDAAVAAWSAARTAAGTARTLPEPRPADPALGGAINY